MSGEKILEALETPIAGYYDVIVCGGGPAGVGAAVTAARQGKKTLLIEQNGYLGGMWTAGLVNPFFDQENKGGLVKELVDHLKEEQAFGAFWDICFDFESMKFLLDTTCEMAGVTVLFHTTFARPMMEQKKVTGVIVENKSGRQAYRGAVVIDCTGDGDVAARAGVEFRVGRPVDQATQPMTMMFLLGNVDYWQDKPTELYDLMKKAVDTHDTGYRIDFQHPFLIRLPKGRYAVVQLTHLRNYTSLDAASLSAAEQEGRKQVMETFRFFKKYIPEFQNVDLITTAPHIGVRESRRIVGLYSVTKEDAQKGQSFSDGIVNVAFGIDIHEPGSSNQTCLTTRQYQIPYRCLIPKEVDGLLVAGRCISGEYEAHASYRVTGDCMAMGEAAGFAAAAACEKRCEVREIDGGWLKERLGIQDARRKEG